MPAALFFDGFFRGDLARIFEDEFETFKVDKRFFKIHDVAGFLKIRAVDAEIFDRQIKLSFHDLRLEHFFLVAPEKSEDGIKCGNAVNSDAFYRAFALFFFGFDGCIRLKINVFGEQYGSIVKLENLSRKYARFGKFLKIGVFDVKFWNIDVYEIFRQKSSVWTFRKQKRFYFKEILFG